MLAIHADAWFDGERLHHAPVTVCVQDGRIAAVHPGRLNLPGAEDVHVGFIMPGLVESHAHLFLDGHEQDPTRRQAHMEAGREVFLATGRRNLQRLRAAGITLVRDCGDRWGINHALRAMVDDRTTGRPDDRTLPQVRSAGIAIRRKGRYGSFMAEEVVDAASAAAAVRARADSDDIKIVMTGIIDFAAAAVKGGPQFDLSELSAMTSAARELGKPTVAHCSGREGIDIAVRAGIGSIEHGFFLDAELLDRMAAAGTAWTPTWIPVAWVREHPEACAVGPEGVAGLGRILDQHRANLLQAHRRGVAILAGSDAGSLGVRHGDGLHDDLAAYLEAGLPLPAVLAAATSVPRRVMGLPGGRLAAGEPADLAGFAASPLAGLSYLRRAAMTCIGGRIWRAEATTSHAAA
ncbi:MAG: amidohydrolase family protein [Planctomycetes bacterium]|nr:amidohydrolase family protein [Planctomycetota bacterium]